MNHRLQITIAGVVQGVGFRPFVFGLASRLGLAGFVTNRAGDVVIEVEGNRAAVERMLDLLHSECPSAARIDRLDTRVIAVRGESTFEIAASEESSTAVAAIAPDVATCDACLAEISDPRERRFGYPFASCAACGPRLTIVTAAPYDRERTTMAPFAMCDPCRSEYEDVTDRRFHAQPIACPACGPQLDVSIDELAAALVAGEIVALKGLGGYHLVCDATREDVVARLRDRKQRDAKPFAIMVRDLDEAHRIAELDGMAAALLASPARPIVLARRRDGATGGRARSIAPHVDDVGVMLPYTPLHHLLLAAVGRPLVMTSGNVTDEPIAFRDDDARTRLGAVADRVITCDREIHIRCEDSVARVVDGAPMILRRARGYAPAPLRLPVPLDRPTLALGGHFKSTFALGNGDISIVSPHLGDLDHLSAYEAFEAALEHFQTLHRITPERVVHDLHPDYATTRLAERFALPRAAIQHHHAHFASAHADAMLEGLAIGVIFDGHGYAGDGTIWGGEVLVGDCASSRRAAHLRAVPQPGGDRAAREPWRMAIAYLREADESIDYIVDRRGPIANRVAALCAGAPLASSAGRLFDAVAAILGICDVSSYEGEAAMRLESLARSERTTVVYPVHIVPSGTHDASLFARGSQKRVDIGTLSARGSHQNIPIARDPHIDMDVRDLRWLGTDATRDSHDQEADAPARVSRQFDVDVFVDTPPYGSRLDVDATATSGARELDVETPPYGSRLEVDAQATRGRATAPFARRSRQLDLEPPAHGSRRLDVNTPARGSRRLDVDATTDSRDSNVDASARDDRTARAVYTSSTKAEPRGRTSAMVTTARHDADGADLLDTLPIIRAVVRDHARGVSAATIARRFHNTLVELAARACVAIAHREGVRDVVLSGGVFANAILASELPARLRAYGLVPHLQRRVPPNDGGLSFGQLAAIAAADRGAS